MPNVSEKRKLIEEKVLKTMKILDPKGYNEELYKALYSHMSDAQFTKYVEKLLSDDDNNFTLETTPFEKDNIDLNIENIKKAADYLKVPLDEYLYMPFENEGGKPLRSKEKTPVGYVHIKRLGTKRSLRNVA